MSQSSEDTGENERAIVALLTEFIDWYNKKFSKPSNKAPALTAGIAGGFATWAFCKWVLFEDPEWKTRDCDVYIHPIEGDLFNWRCVCNSFVGFVELHSNHVIAKVNEERKVRYNSSNRDMHVRDFYVVDIGQPISFIYDSMANNGGPLTIEEKMHSVVSSYDINIVKVILYFHPKVRFEAEKDIKICLKSKEARVVRDITFVDFCPTKKEIGVLVKTLERIQKYSDRGYRFTNLPRIVCLSKTETAQTVDNSNKLLGENDSESSSSVMAIDDLSVSENESN